MTHSHHCLADNGGMDSARSWAVAAACAWINFFTFAVVRSAAVVFASLLQTFPVTREQASWPVNLTVVCVFFSGTIAGVLARHIAIWKLNLFGCIGGSLAVAACFFAPSILFLNLFLGVIQGLFRDTRGDYEGLFSLIGGVTVGISIPWLYPCVGQKCSSRNGSLINFSRLRSMRSSRK
ncbi:monocarboxylate transporter 7-like isoform X2 [Amblyomma americanum]